MPARRAAVQLQLCGPTIIRQSPLTRRTPMTACARTLASQYSPAASFFTRIAQAHAMLQRCELCELRCQIDRTKGEPCPCRLGTDTYEYKRYVSLNEEAELVPAMRVFLSGCNFR